MRWREGWGRFVGRAEPLSRNDHMECQRPEGGDGVEVRMQTGAEFAWAAVLFSHSSLSFAASGTVETAPAPSGPVRAHGQRLM